MSIWLKAIAKNQLRDFENVSLICADILVNKNTINQDALKQLASMQKRLNGDVLLIANLPYQVATPLVMNLLVGCPSVRRLCFTVQQEVGDRLMAKSGCKEYGPLGIIAQSACRLETIAQLPPHVFWPRPSVGSVMIRMDVLDAPLLEPESLNEFSLFVRSVFEHRRKTLRSALGYAVNDEIRERICGQVDAVRRPESLSIDEWVEMFRLLQG